MMWYAIHVKPALYPVVLVVYLLMMGTGSVVMAASLVVWRYLRSAGLVVLSSEIGIYLLQT